MKDQGKKERAYNKEKKKCKVRQRNEILWNGRKGEYKLRRKGKVVRRSFRANECDSPAKNVRDTWEGNEERSEERSRAFITVIHLV